MTTFEHINNNDSWARCAYEIKCEFKRLKLGKPKIERRENSRGVSWLITSKKSVEFQDGHIGILQISLSPHQVYHTAQWSIVDPDKQGYSYGRGVWDLGNIRALSKEATKRHKAFMAVRKLYPKATLNLNTITLNAAEEI